MRKMIIAFACYLLQTLQPLTAATEISPGVLYPSGTRLQVSTLGISFQVPQNWQAMLPQGSEVLIMEPTNAAARIIVSAMPARASTTTARSVSSPTSTPSMTSSVAR